MDYSNMSVEQALDYLKSGKVPKEDLVSTIAEMMNANSTLKTSPELAKYLLLLRNRGAIQDAQQAAEAANAGIAEVPEVSETPTDALLEEITPNPENMDDVMTERRLEALRRSASGAPIVDENAMNERRLEMLQRSANTPAIPNPEAIRLNPSIRAQSTAPSMYDRPIGPSRARGQVPIVQTPTTAETLIDGLAESGTTATPMGSRYQSIVRPLGAETTVPRPTREIYHPIHASDEFLLNALKPGSDSPSKSNRKLKFKTLGSSNSGLDTLTGGVPEGFVKPERPVVGDMSAPKARLSGIGESVANAVGTAPTAPRTVTFGSGGLRGTGVSSDAIGLSKPKGVRGVGGGTSGGLTGLFGNIFGGGGASNPANARVAGASQARAGRGSIFAPGFGTRVQEGLGKLSDPQLDWTKGTGLKAYGHNIGGLASTAQGLYGAYQIADALSENTKAKNTTEDITSDILTAAAGNPMAAYDLTADQKRLLGELKRGSYDDSSDMGSLDWGAGLSGALKGGVAGFLGGGTTGAIVGALSSGVPAAMRGMASEQERKNAELEALYAALSESDARFRDARRQKAMQMYY